MFRKAGKRVYQEPESVGHILPKLLKHITPRKNDGLKALREIWPSLVGEAIAKRSRVAAYHGGEIILEVSSSALRQDLGIFRREQLLKTLSEALPETPVSGLKCRVGTGF
jgi:hypothetical protein